MPGAGDDAALIAALRETNAGQREILEILKSAAPAPGAAAGAVAARPCRIHGPAAVGAAPPAHPTLVALPGILLCAGLIAWLLVRYF